jgi:hypothetical protein
MIEKKISPVIVIGMHRSGTSLLSKLLEGMGVFMGADWEENNESEFFIEINDWLLKQAGVCWLEPASFNYISDDFKSVMTEIVRNRLKTYHRNKYLGKHKKNKNLADLDFAWGWKDPRNTFTWEIWKEIFPEAKIIHLYRNPVDVVSSLNIREPKSIFFTGNPTRTGLKKKLLGYFLPSKRIFIHSFRSMSLYGSFEFWKEYVSKALTVNEKCPDKILHLKYEDLLSNPEKSLVCILSFLQMELDSPTLKKLTSFINPERRFAFRGNEKYETFYLEIKNDPLLVRLKYNNI